MFHGSHCQVSKAIRVPAATLVYTVNNVAQKSWTISSCNSGDPWQWQLLFQTTYCFFVYLALPNEGYLCYNCLCRN